MVDTAGEEGKFMSLRLTAMMYVPGSDEAKLTKINSLPPNAYIIDLEDAVAQSVKVQARSLVGEFLSKYQGEQQLWVRVNGIDTGYMLEDLSAVVTPATVGIVIPKVEDSRTVHIVEWLLGELEYRAGLQPGTIHVMPLIETAAGISRLEEVIKESKRTLCLAFGAGDYSLDLGVEWPPPGGHMSPLVLAAKVKLVELSRTFGLLPPHDGVFPDIRDKETLASEALAAYSMGFGGKHAIHPGQVDVIRRSFTPSEQQRAWARRIVEAFNESEARGIAAIEIDGRFIDYPVVHRARQVLAMCDDELGKGDSA